MTVPRVDYAGQREKEKKGETRTVDPGVQAILMRNTDPRVRDIIEKVAETYDLPAHGITVLGGNPYVNVTGLDHKVEKKWLNQGWVKTERALMIQYAKEENEYLAGCIVTIEFFNYKDFNEMVQSIKENITAELVKELRETHTVSFKSEGWASPKSCAAIAYDYVWSQEAGKKVPGDLLVENVNMMAERKASNRAKRAAVGCGLTSVEEIIGKDSQVIDVVPDKNKGKVKEIKPTDADFEVQKDNPDEITTEQIDEVKNLAREIGYKKLDTSDYKKHPEVYHEDMKVFNRMKELIFKVKELHEKRVVEAGFLKQYAISDWDELHRVPPQRLVEMIEELKRLPLANEPEKVEVPKRTKAEKIQAIKDKIKDLEYKENSPEVTSMLTPYGAFNVSQLVSLSGATLDKILKEEFAEE